VTFTETLLVGRTSSVALAALGPANSILLIVSEAGPGARNMYSASLHAHAVGPQRLKAPPGVVIRPLKAEM
jgi:hypothetical protein